ncbi:hypothetical protein [Bradyrhizobium sp. sGM-13]|uniref:hypothetical protein n=1 Tax=Bradyrhizobium sp. sGM-13 TaxID=2831781 RepID=UPI001BCE7DED|nr:hypothetical protein [Bradyrhizobium sp. sGM-13]
MIGALAASKVLSEQELIELLRLALNPILAGKEAVHSYKDLIAGAVRVLRDTSKCERVLKGVTAGLSDEATARLLVLASFGKNTWNLVDTLSEPAQAKYWNEVAPEWIRDSDSENNEAVERLLKADRPRAAFSCIRYEPQKLDAQVLYRLLLAMAQGGGEPPGHYMLEHYHVEAAFKSLNGSAALTLDQKARLEFAYIDTLAGVGSEGKMRMASRIWNGISKRTPNNSLKRSRGLTSATTGLPIPPNCRFRPTM